MLHFTTCKMRLSHRRQIRSFDHEHHFIGHEYDGLILSSNTLLQNAELQNRKTVEVIGL